MFYETGNLQLWFDFYGFFQELFRVKKSRNNVETRKYVNVREVGFPGLSEGFKSKCK